MKLFIFIFNLFLVILYQIRKNIYKKKNRKSNRIFFLNFFSNFLLKSIYLSLPFHQSLFLFYKHKITRYRKGNRMLCCAFLSIHSKARTLFVLSNSFHSRFKSRIPQKIERQNSVRTVHIPSWPRPLLVFCGKCTCSLFTHCCSLRL